VTRSVSGSIDVEIASEPLPKIFTVSIFRWYVAVVDRLDAIRQRVFEREEVAALRRR
jgi:hypothetical protein